MRAEPQKLLQAPTLDVLTDPRDIAACVRRTHEDLGCLLDEDESAALLADALCQDCPIVGVTRGFVALTGYSREELLGKNCRILLNGVSEVAISKSARKNLRDFFRMCRFVGLSQISEATSLQPNRRQDGSLFMNFFMVGLCMVERHPYILGVQMMVGDGIIAKLSSKQMQQVTEESRAVLLRLRRRLTMGVPPPSPPPLRSSCQPPLDFAFYAERLQDHCTLFNRNQMVMRREPHELATNCLVYSDAPIKRSDRGLFFAAKVNDIVGSFHGLPLLGFTRRKPADTADLYPPVTKCLGSSVLIGACGEAFARDKHEHFQMGFKAPPSSEVQVWTLQQDVPDHKREPPLAVQPNDELGCLYTCSGRLQFWRNGRKAMEFDLGRPPKVGVDYYAVVDVCFAVYSLTLNHTAPPVEAEEPAGANAAAGTNMSAALTSQQQQQPLAPSQLQDLTGLRGPRTPAPRQCQLRPDGYEDPLFRPFSGKHCARELPKFVDCEAVERAIRAAVADCGFCVSVANPAGEVPLIAVSEEFEAMTGYCRNEILGKNCRFLNDGCQLSIQDLMALRMSASNGAPFTALLPNRKKTGELFVNLLDLQGLAVARHTGTGEVLWYCVGVQADVTGIDDETVPERHDPQRHEVARHIGRHLQQEAARASCAATRHMGANSSGSGGWYVLLDEPLWMHGSEWLKDCTASGADAKEIDKLLPTMPPGSKFLPEPRSFFGEQMAEGPQVGKAGARAFSKAYSDKAGPEALSSERKSSLQPPQLVDNTNIESTLWLLKGWFYFSLPAMGALCLLVGGKFCRKLRQ